MDNDILRKYNVINDGIQPIKGKYSFEDFARIIAHLRSENGCPWDKAQTHGSMKQCVIEEAYEVVEAINIYEETGSYDNLCEELGDIMLQSMMHTQIASEEGIFNMGDVIDRVCDKMISRHTHVFGQVKADSPDEAFANWEDMKKEEKKKLGIENDKKSELQSIPRSFPALIKSHKVHKKIEKINDIKYNVDEGINHVEELVEQLKQLKSDNYDMKEDSKAHLECDFSNIMADLLYEMVGISRYYGINAEECLMNKLDKIIMEDCNDKN